MIEVPQIRAQARGTSVVQGARLMYVIAVLAFVGCVLVQVYFAGLAVLVNPVHWGTACHVRAYDLMGIPADARIRPDRTCAWAHDRGHRAGIRVVRIAVSAHLPARKAWVARAARVAPGQCADAVLALDHACPGRVAADARVKHDVSPFSGGEKAGGWSYTRGSITEPHKIFRWWKCVMFATRENANVFAEAGTDDRLHARALRLASGHGDLAADAWCGGAGINQRATLYSASRCGTRSTDRIYRGVSVARASLYVSLDILAPRDVAARVFLLFFMLGMSPASNLYRLSDHRNMPPCISVYVVIAAAIQLPPRPAAVVFSAPRSLPPPTVVSSHGGGQISLRWWSVSQS